MHLDTTLKKWVAAILTVLATVAVTVTATGSWDNSGPHGTVTIHVGSTTTTETLDGPGHAAIVVTPAVKAQTKVIEKKAATDTGDVHVDLRTSPEPISAATEKANANKAPLGQQAIPAHPAQAAPSTAGCRTRLVGNYSSRNGAPILLGVVHLTDSPPSDGWAGVDANTSWFNSTASQASSNYIMSRAGLCNYVVPEYYKAWTQAGFNPWAISVEVTTNESPSTFMTAAGNTALVKLLYGWHKRWNIPIRRAQVSGCQVVRSGYLDHRSLGTCGGNHGDIAPYNVDTIISRLKAYDVAQQPKPVPAVYVRECQRLNAFRKDRTRGRDARTGKPVSRNRLQVNIDRRKRLERHKIKCTSKGAVHA